MTWSHKFGSGTSLSTQTSAKTQHSICFPITFKKTRDLCNPLNCGINFNSYSETTSAAVTCNTRLDPHLVQYTVVQDAQPQTYIALQQHLVSFSWTAVYIYSHIPHRCYLWIGCTVLLIEFCPPSQLR